MPRPSASPSQPQRTFAAVSTELRGLRPVSHANRGKFLEHLLDRTHHLYRTRGIGDVEYINNAFLFCADISYHRLPPNLRAVTGDGRYLRRAKTSSDYRGVLRGRGIAFDAKEFRGNRFAFKTNIKSHQIDSLLSFSRAGGLAGFLLYSYESSEAFWLTAQAVQSLVTQSTSGQKGSASVSLDWLHAHALCLGVVSGSVLDYAAKIIEHGSNPVAS